MKKRLFIAIDISDEARSATERHITLLRNSAPAVRVGWEKPEKLHITLKFLGDVDEMSIEALSRVLSHTAGDSSGFEIRLNGAGVFPNPRRPGILWLGIADRQGEMADLAKRIDDAVSAIGFATEPRRFKPHLTIARIREPHKGRQLAARHLDTAFDDIAFAVRELVLYESVLGRGSSIYSLVSSYPLGSSTTSPQGTSR